MNFQLEELTEQVAHTARDFANRHIRPNVMVWDESQEFPKALFKDLGKLGIMGVLVPEEYGGAGLSYIEYVTIIQGNCQSMRINRPSLAAHNSLCIGHILSFQKQRSKENTFPSWLLGIGSVHGD
jgi:alkylation response protein AidB-like acyl-CoA dehydrogenase